MTAIVKYITVAALALFSLMSCNNEASLQQYLVAKQDDDAFVKVDLPSSLLDSEESASDAEQKEILKTVKKVNIVAYPIKNGNLAQYQIEKDKVNTILADDMYKMLSKMKSNNMDVTLKYVGDDDAIDEVIIFASSEEKGFAVLRLLGKNMRPEKMLQLVNSLDKSNVDMSQMSMITNMFDL